MGGELRANVTMGEQELLATMPMGDNGNDLRPLVDQLLVKIQQVEFVSTATGGEIRTNMTVGERSFVSRLVVEGDDQDLRPMLDHLLSEVGRKFVQNLQAALAQDDAFTPQAVR